MSLESLDQTGPVLMGKIGADRQDIRSGCPQVRPWWRKIGRGRRHDSHLVQIAKVFYDTRPHRLGYTDHAVRLLHGGTRGDRLDGKTQPHPVRHARPNRACLRTEVPEALQNQDLWPANGSDRKVARYIHHVVVLGELGDARLLAQDANRQWPRGPGEKI